MLNELMELMDMTNPREFVIEANAMQEDLMEEPLPGMFLVCWSFVETGDVQQVRFLNYTIWESEECDPFLGSDVIKELQDVVVNVRAWER